MRALRSSGDTNVILEQLETRRLYSAVVLLDGELHRPPICMADLNHDGKADAVVAYRRTSGGLSTVEIDVQLNNGKGTFVAGTPSGFYDDNNPLKHQVAADIAVGDLDGDGNADIALKLYSITAEVQPVGAAPTDAISISVVPFFGDGKGGFTQGKQMPLPHTLTRSLTSLVDILSPNNGIAIGDVDGDGFGDIVSWIGGDNIAVALMAGRGPRQTVSLDGSFGPRNRGFSQTLGLADMDGDKQADLVACVNNRIFYTSFASGFAKPVYIPPIGGNVDANIDGVFLADADGDGKSDDLVVMANNRLIVGTTGGLASGAAASATSSKWTWRRLDGTYNERADNVLVGDVDGDGYSDLFTVVVKANHDMTMKSIQNIRA